jgi:deoxyribose-phosphate aldolase
LSGGPGTPCRARPSASPPWSTSRPAARTWSGSSTTLGEALKDGADEIDLVLPYRALLRGEPGVARDVVAGVRDMVDQERTLKVILETGMLPSPESITEASRLAVEAGADFLKTSTGKTPVSATPEAAAAMLSAIREASRPVGLKVSGGIRTLGDARRYLDLADRAMGAGWAKPQTFRIGASGLYDALVSAIEGRPAVAAGGPRAY